MGLSITDKKQDNVLILSLSGKITVGEGSVQFREAIREALENGERNFLLNFENTSYIDSSGIGELVSAYTTTNNLGGQLKLLHLAKKIQDLLMITKLLTVFQTFDSEEEAIASFQ